MMLGRALYADVGAASKLRRRRLGAMSAPRPQGEKDFLTHEA
jgi:hypothetical protein